MNRQATFRETQFDKLTGLNSRAAMIGKITEAAVETSRTGQPVYLIDIDIDRFKHINDSIGDQQGDELIKLFADRLRSNLPEGIEIGRIGSGQFGVLLPDGATPLALDELVEQLIELMMKPYQLKTHLQSISISVGIVAMPKDGDDAVLPIVGDLDNGIYFRPEAGGRDIIVGSTDPACDPLEFVDDPDAMERNVTTPYRDRQCLRLMKRFPRVTMGPPRGVADLYDVTVRDWYPIVDRTDLPGYYVCIGTSGSSFKTSPVLGKLMAEIVTANEAGHDTDAEPVQLELPRIGATVDTRFLGRHRRELKTSSTVIG